MGVAFGYHTTAHGVTGDFDSASSTVAAAAHGDTSVERITKLEQTVMKLGDEIERLVVSSSNNSTNTGRNCTNVNNQRVCYNCSATGHIKRRCNLASGQGDPDALCQLCSQCGHTATQCKLFVGNQSSGNSGNVNTKHQSQERAKK